MHVTINRIMVLLLINYVCMLLLLDYVINRIMMLLLIDYVCMLLLIDCVINRIIVTINRLCMYVTINRINLLAWKL